MLQIPIKDVIARIESETSTPAAEIQNLIKAKMQALEGLVSEDGAAYIVASELGVQLFKDTRSGAIKIKDILVGMKSVETHGKVMRAFNPTNFTGKDGQPKQVASMIIADETDQIRAVIWDQRASWITEGRLKEGTIVKIKDAYVKQNLRGDKELHLGQKSSLMLDPKNIVIESVAAKTFSSQMNFAKKKIVELQPNDSALVLGTVVQAFPPRFYPTCPQCGKKVTVDAAGSVCAVHKSVTAKSAMILNFVVDDSTETLRCVAFRDNASSLIDMSVEEAQEIISKDGQANFDARVEAFLLGRIVEVAGRVSRNEEYDRTELLVNQVNVNPDPKGIAREMLK
ncbi:MAG: hypothetical protein AABX75_01500 [Nanoarchaeota archaeon]